MTTSNGHAASDPEIDRLDAVLGARLRGERPAPTAVFQDELRTRLQAQDLGYGPRPERLRLTVGFYVAAGAALIILAAAAVFSGVAVAG